MITPALLSGEGYSLAFASETPRTNYLRGGLSFGTAYDDNVLPSSGHADQRCQIFDLAQPVFPTIPARLAWSLNYSPGFGVYQHNSSINEIDHYLTVGLSYRLDSSRYLESERIFPENLQLDEPVSIGRSTGHQCDCALQLSLWWRRPSLEPAALPK